MIKKLMFAAMFLAAPLAMSETASADHLGCYSTYRVPVVRSPYHYGIQAHPGLHTHRGVYRSMQAPVYGYGVPYRSRSVSGYGIYGYPHYRRGSSIGISRGGVSLYFGF